MIALRSRKVRFETWAAPACAACVAAYWALWGWAVSAYGLFATTFPLWISGTLGVLLTGWIGFALAIAARALARRARR